MGNLDKGPKSKIAQTPTNNGLDPKVAASQPKEPSRKKSSVKKAKSVSKNDSKLKLLTSESMVKSGLHNVMADTMVDAVIHNYSQGTCKPSDSVAVPLSKKKKSKTKSVSKNDSKLKLLTPELMVQSGLDDVMADTMVDALMHNYSQGTCEPSDSVAVPLSKKKKRKTKSVSKQDSKLKLLTPESMAPSQFVSEMASTMVDKVMHNYSQGTCEPSDSVDVPLSKKMALPTPSEGENDNHSKDVKDPKGAQELAKLTDCVKCQWKHNYHPCLLSNSEDNQKCKLEMKRKGYDYKEPQQCCTEDKCEGSVGDGPAKKSVSSKKPSQQKTGGVGKKPTTANTRPSEEQPLPPKLKKTLSVKINPIPPKTNPNVENENIQKASSITKMASKKQSKSVGGINKSVKKVSSKLDNNSALDLLNKINPKKSRKTVADKDDKDASSVPASTFQSQTRFNPKEPSPSDTHLPPVTISSSQVTCNNPDLETSNCEPHPLKSKKVKKAKSSAEKKENACDWHENHHPCDQPDINKDGESADQQLCKVWKKRRNEMDPSKIAESSCKSILTEASVLDTTPSEKAYIDKVVKTAVKLAKQNAPPSKRARRRSRTDSVTSGFSRVDSVVDNAIDAAAAIAKTQLRPATVKYKSKLSGIFPEESATSTAFTRISSTIEKQIGSLASDESNRHVQRKSKKSVPTLSEISQQSSTKKIQN